MAFLDGSVVVAVEGSSGCGFEPREENVCVVDFRNSPPPPPPPPLPPFSKAGRGIAGEGLSSPSLTSTQSALPGVPGVPGPGPAPLSPARAFILG